jgi:hypothetical protein
MYGENLLVASLARDDIELHEIEETIKDIQARLEDITLDPSQQVDYDQVIKDVTRDSFLINGTGVDGPSVVQSIEALLRELDIAGADKFQTSLLSASARTISGGDSYYVLQERFGGPQVMIRPSSAQAAPIKIDISQAGAEVAVEGVYDVYSREAIDRMQEDIRPLVQLHATTVESLKRDSTPDAITGDSSLLMTRSRYLRISLSTPESPVAVDGSKGGASTRSNPSSSFDSGSDNPIAKKAARMAAPILAAASATTLTVKWAPSPIATALELQYAECTDAEVAVEEDAGGADDGDTSPTNTGRRSRSGSRDSEGRGSFGTERELGAASFRPGVRTDDWKTVSNSIPGGMTSVSYKIGGLVPGTLYVVRLRANYFGQMWGQYSKQSSVMATGITRYSYCAHAVLILHSYCTHTVLILMHGYWHHQVLILHSYCTDTALILH